MLVELETGAPLFPGTSDVDQLWRILQSLCSPSLGYAAAVHAHPMFKVGRMHLCLSLSARITITFITDSELVYARLHNQPGA